MHDDLKQAMAKVHEVAKTYIKSSEIYSTSGDQARLFADQGFQMVVTGIQNICPLADI